VSQVVVIGKSELPHAATDRDFRTGRSRCRGSCVEDLLPARAKVEGQGKVEDSGVRRRRCPISELHDVQNRVVVPSVILFELKMLPKKTRRPRTGMLGDAGSMVNPWSPLHRQVS
jgi:hypothetical protein